MSYFAKEPAMASKNKKRKLSPSIYFSLNRVIGLKVEKIEPKRSKKWEWKEDRVKRFSHLRTSMPSVNGPRRLWHQTPLITGSAHLKLKAPTFLVAVWSKPEDKNDSRIYISLCLKSEIINYLQWTFGQFDDTDILGVEKTSFCKN